MFVSPSIEIRKTSKGKALFAKKKLNQGEVVLEFEQRFVSTSTHTTLRIDEHLHQESTDPEAAENFINHACEPNGYIDFADLTFRALRDIAPGEELTYNYYTTDWDDEDVFECRCGSPHCYQKINGFKHLTLEQKQKLEPWLSPFLKKKLREAEKEPAHKN